jgi:hypothetical protein
MIKKIILALICLLAITPVLAGQTSTLTIQSSGNVDIQNVQDLYGFDIKIVWDPTELTLMKATFNPIWTNYFVAIDKNSADFYRLVVVSISGSFSGSATLVSLEFAGEGSISFELVKLSYSHWQPIPVTLNPLHIVDAFELVFVVEQGIVIIVIVKSIVPGRRITRPGFLNGGG